MRSKLLLSTAGIVFTLVSIRFAQVQGACREVLKFRLDLQPD